MSFAGLPGPAQQLVWSTNTTSATASGAKAYFPNAIMGQFIECTVYVQFSAASSAGKVQIQTAHDTGYAGAWANVGSTLDWAVGSSEKYASITGVFGALRLNVDTTVADGTVSAFIVVAPH